jgi:hypothetical protein
MGEVIFNIVLQSHDLKGIVKASTETFGDFRLGLNKPRRYVYSKSRAAKRYDASNRETLDLKWLDLENSLLLSSALKYVPQIMAIRGV